MRPKILLVSALVCLLAAPVRAMTTAERQAYLAWMLKTLPDDPEWDAWQKATGELPPDFDALARSNALPDPLKFLDGRAVASEGDWTARRQEIWGLMQHYQTGTFPPKPPIDRVEVQGETRGAGWVTRNVKLIFGPADKGSVRVQVTIPDGAGPKPVLICTSLGGWGPALIRRGYISAGFAGNDFMDDEAALQDVYPDYDFATLPRRAWAVQLVIDYLDTLPEVDPAKIAIFGYSRDGKMVATAAALDTRIAAVVAGSTGVGGILPWRIAGERGNGEGIETTTRMFPTWFVPRLRYFSGREDRLPVDANLLVSLIAPRACLMEYGLNDEVSNSWGSEQTYRSAVKVYDLLGHPERLDILRCPGFHGANDPDACLDWLDMQFGRTDRRWTNSFLFPWSFAHWKELSGDRVDLSRYPARAGEELLAASATPADWAPKAAALRQAISWALGAEPPLMPPLPPPVFRGRPMRPAPPGPTVVAEGHYGNPGQLAPDVPAWVIARGGPVSEFGWPSTEKDAVSSRKFRFGDGVTGDLYLPAHAAEGAKLPTVIWLHGFSYPLGYMWVYRRDLHPILALAKAGYAVLAYDQCGFGSRMAEIGPFYDRFPHWSQMGRMVEDVHQAVGALQKDKQVDPDKIYLYGFTLGGEVGLYAAATDPRIKGVVSVAGFTPMRTDTPDRGTSGVARYAFERGFLPRLGFFVGHEAQIPYDFDGLIGLIAPRPVLVVQPSRDRDATPADVRAAVERARQVYHAFGADGKLGLAEPDDIARLPNATLDSSISWMHDNF